MYNKIAFYLMTFKGYWVLKEYIAKFDTTTIEAVIVCRDTNVDDDYYHQICELCQQNKIAYFNRKDEYVLNSELVFAISWRWLISVPNKIIVLHDSLLPKYRGFAPLVNSLINKEDKVGVTALYASESYDCGDIISQKALEIKYPIKIKDVIDLISPIYSELVSQIANRYFSGEEITGIKQNNLAASYSLWRDEEDYFIDWNNSASFIKRFVDSVGAPYKGARCKMGETLVGINEATVVDDLHIVNRDIGKVIFFDSNRPVVVCKSGLLRLDEIIDVNNNKSLLPFNKFRIRFK